MERKTYTVYKITLPSGNVYIGYTSMTIQERWKNHIKRAASNEAIHHPFYCELRDINPDLCSLECLSVFDNRQDAMDAEIDEIAKIPPDISLNLSSGGINDASFGGKIFWERINANPEEREKYLKKLSDRKKADDWSDYAALTQRSLAWRKEHPKEAYKNSYRAIRIANKAQSRNTASKPELSLKERLRRKHKLNDVKSEYVSQVWGNRSAEERKAISEKISQTLKARMAELSDSERQSITEKARASIDRKKQGAAASAGLKRFWEELRRNPEQYREYIDRRRESLKSKLKERCNENV